MNFAKAHLKGMIIWKDIRLPIILQISPGTNGRMKIWMDAQSDVIIQAQI